MRLRSFRWTAYLASILAAGPLVAFGSCSTVYTTWPSVPASIAVIDDRLLGAWTDPTEAVPHVGLEFRRGDSVTYRIKGIDGRDTTYLIGKLGRLGDRWLLDLVRAPNDSAPNDEAIAGHFQAVLEIADSSITFWGLIADTLVDRVERHEASFVVLTLPNDDILIGDETDSLLPRLARYLARPESLERGAEYRRWVPKPPPTRRRPRG